MRVQQAHLALQRRHRLKKSADFQRVRALKQSWAHPLLVLYVAPNGLAITRVGISTSKRLGKAVIRNRVKRLIRESVRALLPIIPGGRDLVFVARPASAQADYQSVKRAVGLLLERARLLPKQPRPENQGAGAGKEHSAAAAKVENRPEERNNTDDEVDRALFY